MIENAIQIRQEIDAKELELRQELDRLVAEGHARWISWSDKYDAHMTCVISENKELLAKISIDGFSKNDDYIYPIGEDDYGYMPKDSKELIRISGV